MKVFKFLCALVLGVSFVACSQSKTSSELKSLTPSKAEIDSVSYYLGISMGAQVYGMDWGDLNYTKMMKGIKDLVNAKGDYRDADFFDQFELNPNEGNEKINAYLQKRMTIVSEGNKIKGEKYLADNAKKAGVQTTDSGLQYKIVEAGNDVKPSVSDTVWVKYKGTTIDGKVFDQTSEDGDPVMFRLDSVIPGWSEGLQLIGEGGKIELVIPSVLAYGETGQQTIEPNSVLCFEVELTKVGKVAPVEEAIEAE